MKARELESLHQDEAIADLTEWGLLTHSQRPIHSPDISPFISLLQAGGFFDEADINGDGVVDFSDISFFIDLLIAQ